ncbi:MAG: hypothetical protein AAGJ81_08140 [Verrucomicrobiota bacterium]
MDGPDKAARAEQLAQIIQLNGDECSWKPTDSSKAKTFRAMLQKEPLVTQMGPFARNSGGSESTLHVPRDQAAFAKGYPKTGETITLPYHKLRVTEPDDNPGSLLLTIKGSVSPR